MAKVSTATVRLVLKKNRKNKNDEYPIYIVVSPTRSFLNSVTTSATRLLNTSVRRLRASTLTSQRTTLKRGLQSLWLMLLGL